MRNTKALIAGAFSQLLEEKPYRRITVRDIVERCSVNRNTFYRYYPDIPSLLQAIVQEKGDWLIENYCQQGQPILCIRPLIQYSLDHRRAVLHVYRSLPREEFQAGLARITGYLVEGYFQKAGEGLAIPPENRAFLTRFYRCAMMGGWPRSRACWPLCSIRRQRNSASARRSVSMPPSSQSRDTPIMAQR